MKSLLSFFLFAALVSINQLSLSAEFQFKCPESLTVQERKKNAEEFWDYCRKEHPDWTIRDVIDYRMKLLEEHGCSRTLENIRTSAEADKSSRYLCVEENGQRYFSSQRSDKCKEIKLEQGWENFSLIPSAIVDIKAGSLISEPDGKTIWVRFYLAGVYAGVDGRWNYDYVESMNKFYCGKQETRLINGTYKLGGKTVHIRPESESVAESVDPGTLNEAFYNFLCEDR